MKNLRKSIVYTGLCALTLGVLTAGATATKAATDDEQAQTTEATVSFTVSYPVVATDEGATGADNVKIVENPMGSTGTINNDLDIMYVTNFDFGTINYRGFAQRKDASPQTFKVKENAEATTTNDLVAPLGLEIVNSGNTSKYKLSVVATPFRAGEAVARGLTIQLPSIRNINTGLGSNLIQPVSATPETPVNIPTDGETSVDIASYTNNTTNPELGVNVLAFGEMESGTYKNGVRLDIPTATSILTTNYVSNLTWTVAVDAD